MIQYDPTGIYEQNPAKGSVCPLLDVSLPLTAPSTLTFIPALAGHKIRVTKLHYAGVSAVAGQVEFASNGIRKHNDALPPNTLPSKTIIDPIAGVIDSETDFSITIAGTQDYCASAHYFYYKP